MLSVRRTLAKLLLPLCCLPLLLPQAAAISAGPGTHAPPLSAPGVPDDEQTRALLQKSLSVAELERDIARIAADQDRLELQIADLQEEAERKQVSIEQKQEKAGEILRAYYMGERDGLVVAMLTSRNWRQLLALFEYYELTAGREQEELKAFAADYRDLQKTLGAAQRGAEELAALRTALEEQRLRVARLDEEIKTDTADSGDPESLQSLLEEFTRYWETIGLHEVKTYFKALSSAMNSLPSFVQNTEGLLTRKGGSYHLALREDDLNAFLRSQNKLFQDFGFHFQDGSVSATGKSGNLTLTLQGHYTIQDKPVNGLIFHVDRIVFNGLDLPDTTRTELENEFDLGFYPEKIVKMLRATEVESADGVLRVKLSLSF
ncbi:hypothetical protein ACE6ED_09570 [Paenibacillus sp. CN-4]|uniref:hypothetical protein n=1 Tax=Paenibacillus nanchangensis TaxID=3348343 RepID=UPI003977F23C